MSPERIVELRKKREAVNAAIQDYIMFADRDAAGVIVTDFVACAAYIDAGGDPGDSNTWTLTSESQHHALVGLARIGANSIEFDDDSYEGDDDDD